MKPKVNHTPRNNPPNLILNVPSYPDSDPSPSDSSLSDSSDSSDNDYSKQRLRTKNNKKKLQSKRFFVNLSKSSQSLQPSYLHPHTNQRLYGSNWMSIHYSSGFISYLLWIPLKTFYHNVRNPTCCLWNIHP